MPTESQMYADKDRRLREEENRQKQEQAQIEAERAAKDKLFQERIMFTHNLILNKQIYDYNGKPDIWGKERTPFGILHYFITNAPITLYDIFNIVPYQFTYGLFKQIKKEFPNLIEDNDWKAFNEAITQNNGCKKNLKRQTNLSCKKNFEDKYDNEPIIYSGGARIIKRSKNQKMRRSKIRRSKNNKI